MQPKHYYFIIAGLLVGFTLLIGIGLATKPQPKSEPIAETVERDTVVKYHQRPSAIRNGDGREDVVRYIPPSTRNLKGFPRIHQNVDEVARKRTEQANEALEVR